jgi:hypothetical protein
LRAGEGRRLASRTERGRISGIIDAAPGAWMRVPGEAVGSPLVRWPGNRAGAGPRVALAAHDRIAHTYFGNLFPRGDTRADCSQAGCTLHAVTSYFRRSLDGSARRAFCPWGVNLDKSLKLYCY